MEEIISLHKEISTQKNYLPTYNLLIDFRKADLIFDTAKVSRYVDFVNNFPQIHGKRKTAFLTSRPNEVVLTTVFGLIKGNLPIDSNTFSTLNAALAWLGLTQANYNLVYTKLEQLKKRENQAAL